MDKVTEKNTIFAFAKVKKDFFKDLGNYLSNYLLIKETRQSLKQSESNRKERHQPLTR